MRVKVESNRNIYKLQQQVLVVIGYTSRGSTLPLSSCHIYNRNEKCVVLKVS